ARRQIRGRSEPGVATTRAASLQSLSAGPGFWSSGASIEVQTDLSCGELGATGPAARHSRARRTPTLCFDIRGAFLLKWGTACPFRTRLSEITVKTPCSCFRAHAL